jgi:peptidyl-prolyl cis-trans isomerase A (cyclophilin A)
MLRCSVCLGLLVLLAGCSGSPPPAPVKKALPAGADLKKMPAPDVYRVLFDTTQGSFIVEVRKEWAPKGAERFWKLVTSGFFNNSRFFRVRPDFIAQFGLAADPQETAVWNASPIDDDPVKEKNRKGTISFAQAGARSRRTQVFVNLKDNMALDKDGFAPFGKILEGIDVFAKLYAGYGEWDPPGRGPNVARIQTQGNSYLDAQYPRLDKILRAKVIK